MGPPLLQSLLSWCRHMDEWEWRKKARQCLQTCASNRKLLVLSVFFFLLLLYFFPFHMGTSFSSSPRATSRCLDDELRHYYRLERAYQVHTQHLPLSPTEKAFIPFTGNGRLGLAFGRDQQLRILSSKRALSTLTGLFPLVDIQLARLRTSNAFVTDYEKGQMKKIECYAIDDDCVSVISTVYAHRTRPYLLIQEVQINNPMDRSIEITLSRQPNRYKEDGRKVGDSRLKIVMEMVASGTERVAIAAVMSDVPEKMTISGRRRENIRFTTVVTVAESIPSLETQQKLVVDEVAKLYGEIAQLSAGKIDQEHETAWQSINAVAFSISLSLAPDALNADLVNATRYALLTNVRTPLLEVNVAETTRKELMNQAGQTELCYNGHSTLMFPSQLWRSMSTIEELLEVVDKWKLTLEKNGCMHLLSVGATGAAQAILLSFGALKFSHHHLEYDVDPSDLHRDYSFTGIPLEGGSNSVKVSIWVEVGSDNKAMMFASLERKDPKKRVFACDAGCLDAPVELTEAKTQFPVKLTLPLTPILYVTSDRNHLEELKHTIHVKEVAIAPAHEHHVLALHKHGHRLGGLPTLFWVTLAGLIIAFHLFLFKLVYNEWLRGDTKTYSYYGRQRYVS